MDDLNQMTCEACRIGAPTVSSQQFAQYMSQLPDWEIVEIEGIKRLRRTYTFADFIQAMAFTHQVGIIAEQQGHHPAILTEWGKVTVTWWSHKIKGLHVNDFVMAARTDRLASTSVERI